MTSIFKLTIYSRCSHQQQRFPFNIKIDTEMYFRTYDEAEHFVTDDAWTDKNMQFLSSTYAYVIEELPIGLAFNNSVLGQSLSRAVYSADGYPNGSEDYSNFIPYCQDSKMTKILKGLCTFTGRDAEDVDFRAGDIVEIFGCVINPYVNNNAVSLGIVIDVPKIKEQQDDGQYQEIKTAKIYSCNADAYKVLLLDSGEVVYSSTICTTSPSIAVTDDHKQQLQKLYNSYLQEHEG